jgi:F0F1-type ATP synthase membrane subunit a
MKYISSISKEYVIKEFNLIGRVVSIFRLFRIYPYLRYPSPYLLIIAEIILIICSKIIVLVNKFSSSKVPIRLASSLSYIYDFVHFYVKESIVWLYHHRVSSFYGILILSNKPIRGICSYYLRARGFPLLCF